MLVVSATLKVTIYLFIFAIKNMRSSLLASLIVLVLLVSCLTGESEKDDLKLKLLEHTRPQYASGFAYAQTPSGYSIKVYNPWQGANGIEYTYSLDSTISRPKLNERAVIPFPVNRVVCLSTTHIAYIDVLNRVDAIVGVSNVNLTTNDIIHNRFSNDLLQEVGYAQALNFEVLVSLQPDVVFAYGVGAEMAGNIQKFTDLGIPLVFVADYLESDPLGKAEWVKFFSLFFDKEGIASTFFSEIEAKYNDVKNLVSEINHRPTVFFNLPWKDIWYVPGSDSYMAKLVYDAGAQYVIKHKDGTSSVPLSLESAMEYGLKANFWLNTGTANSVNDIVKSLPMAAKFSAVQQGYVYNNNKLTNTNGGNDFWESGVVNPHVVLSDLAKIFHPNLIDQQFTYYKKLD